MPTNANEIVSVWILFRDVLTYAGLRAACSAALVCSAWEEAVRYLGERAFARRGCGLPQQRPGTTPLLSAEGVLRMQFLASLGALWPDPGNAALAAEAVDLPRSGAAWAPEVRAALRRCVKTALRSGADLLLPAWLSVDVGPFAVTVPATQTAGTDVRFGALVLAVVDRASLVPHESAEVYGTGWVAPGLYDCQHWLGNTHARLARLAPLLAADARLFASWLRLVPVTPNCAVLCARPFTGQLTLLHHHYVPLAVLWCSAHTRHGLSVRWLCDDGIKQQRHWDAFVPGAPWLVAPP